MRLIDAEIIDTMLTGLICAADGFEHDVKCFEVVRKLLDLVPTIEAVSVVHGRWVRLNGHYLECSICGAASNYESPYCSECGASLMEGAKDD